MNYEVFKDNAAFTKHWVNEPSIWHQCLDMLKLDLVHSYGYYNGKSVTIIRKLVIVHQYEFNKCTCLPYCAGNQ